MTKDEETREEGGEDLRPPVGNTRDLVTDMALEMGRAKPPDDSDLERALSGDVRDADGLDDAPSKTQN